VQLGFSDGSLRIVALRLQQERIERPTEQARILSALGVPQA
jgi:hypothetical protein